MNNHTSAPKIKIPTPPKKARANYAQKKYPLSRNISLWLLYLCYCYAAFIPTGAVWGIHFISYLPVALKVLFLVLGTILFLPNIQQSLFTVIASFPSAEEDEQKINFLYPVILSIAAFILFHIFTIRTDIYGDEINMVKWYGNNTIFDWSWFSDVLSPHWVENKEALTIAVHRLFSHIFSVSIADSYHMVSELCGALFVFSWLLFTQKISRGPLRIILGLLGIFTGATQIFFGHIENYSFGVLTSFLFLLGLYFFIEKKCGTIVFTLLFLLAVKAHIIAILLFPAFITALAYRHQERFPLLNPLFTWRVMRKAVIIPVLLGGLALYIFVFGSWNKPYAFVKGFQLSQSFLPIIPGAAPLDHYSLWSPYHIADFLNLLLMTAAPIIIMLLTLLIFNRKEISWAKPKVMIFSLAALFPFIFCLEMNPQLTPVRDWDIYTLLFPPLLFFTAVLMLEPGLKKYIQEWLSPTLVFGALFTVIFVAVNASPIASVLRLQDAGAYTYRSYYAGSAYIVTRTSAQDTSHILRNHFAQTVRLLSQNWKPGADMELGGMMASLSTLYSSEGNNPYAILWAQSAERADSTNAKWPEYLAGYYVQSGKLTEAAEIIENLIKIRMRPGAPDDLDLPKLARIMNQLSDLFKKQGNDSLSRYWSAKAMMRNP